MLPVMKAEASIMEMSRRVADTESSSNREEALLEELEDELVNFGSEVMPLPCYCADIGCNIVDLWFEHASMATDCRGGMYCLMSCMLSSDPLCFLSHLSWPPTNSWVQVMQSPVLLHVDLLFCCNSVLLLEDNFLD
ncbi:uncharacterized protein [Triticum aestivum]|uniref:uncharacterized protein n=1 Tax=Triticum aestivum TaxID=4565 RepID=UPI001D02AD69|nr:uncharacterized protein LOC123127370 [Triticum aestivum]